MAEFKTWAIERHYFDGEEWSQEEVGYVKAARDENEALFKFGAQIGLREKVQLIDAINGGDKLIARESLMPEYKKKKGKKI